MNNHILIIDDNADMRDIFKDIFDGAGYRVTALSEAENIQEIMLKHQPDLVIVDYLLEGINGGEICAQIKRNEYSKHIPVLLSSAYPRVLYSLGTYGSDDVIEKPFENDRLLERVAYHLWQSQHRRTQSASADTKYTRRDALL
jgi:DNA-binding response OmpR family regulator